MTEAVCWGELRGSETVSGSLRQRRGAREGRMAGLEICSYAVEVVDEAGREGRA